MEISQVNSDGGLRFTGWSYNPGSPNTPKVIHVLADGKKIMKKTAESSVMSLKDLKVGQSAKVAFVSTKNDQQLHKIDGLHIRPGVEVKLHQVYPTYVIECEGVNIALDEEVTANISVWEKPDQPTYSKDNKDNA